MNTEIRFGLKTKFVLVVTLLVVLIITSILYLVINREEEMITRKMEQSGVVLIRSLANACAGPLLQSDFINIKSFMNELKSSQDGNDERDIAYAYVIEEMSGMVQVHINNLSNEDHEMKDVSLFKDDPVMQTALNAKTIVKTLHDKKGKRILELAMPIMAEEHKYGTLRIGMDLSRMQAEIVRTTRNLIWLGIISILLGFLVSLLLAHWILQPVRALVAGAERVAVGEFSHQLPVESSDELGVLAHTFNRMTFNISVLYNVSNAMNFISDSDKLLNIILDKALEALQAERGSLMLLSDEEDTLMVKVIRGLDAEAASFIKIRVGEGVAGYVAATGEPMTVNRGDEDDRFKRYQEWINRSRISSLLCVPLKVEDKVLGVVNIVNKRGEQPFNENDVKLMMVLGAQVAVTLSKAKLYEDSITDGMTKLFIHRYFQARLDDELKRARRYKTNLSLIMFDIDHFKNFNDTYGHQQGDIVIAGVARILRQTIREQVDIASRYGGEEFAVIMPETSLEGAKTLAERIRRNIEIHEFPGQEKPLHVTVSLGISTFPEDAVEKNVLIKLADEALYAAKEAGRNNVQIYGLLKKDDPA